MACLHLCEDNFEMKCENITSELLNNSEIKIFGFTYQRVIKYTLMLE